MTKNTSQKTIIITGASAGIGEAAARELSKDNRVVIVGPEKLQKNWALIIIRPIMQILTVFEHSQRIY